MLTNEELTDLLGLKLNMEIVSGKNKETVEGSLAAAEDGLETYVFYHHGTETKSTLAHEIVVAHYPVYSKERHRVVNRTLKAFLNIVEGAKEKGVYESSDFDALNKLPAEIHYPTHSKGEVWQPSIRLYRGTPIWDANGQLRMNFVSSSTTSYASIAYKAHNKGAEVLNNIGIATATSII